MAKRLKYKIVDKQNRVMHHSFNKRNAEKWVRVYCKNKKCKIKKL